MAGGSHHTVLSQALGTEVIADFAEMTGIELLVIDATPPSARSAASCGGTRRTIT